MLAAVEHGLALLRGGSVGRTFLEGATKVLREYRESGGYLRLIKGFGGLGELIHFIPSAPVSLDRPRKLEEAKVTNKKLNDFHLEWLSRLHLLPGTAGVYVLRIHSLHGLKHAVCADLRTSNPSWSIVRNSSRCGSARDPYEPAFAVVLLEITNV